MSEPQTMLVRFDDLPRPVRERLMPVLTATPRDPRVLAFDVSTVLHVEYPSLIVSAVAIALALKFIIGRVIRDSIGSDWIAYLILAGAGTVFLASLVTIVMNRRWPPPPYRAGRWAFAGTIIETRGGWLEITPMATLDQPTIFTSVREGSGYSHSLLQLGGKLQFFFRSKADVEAARTRFLEAKEKVAALVAKGDAAALAELDPFAECLLSGSWGRPGALSVHGPTVAARPLNTTAVQWLFPLVTSVVLAYLAHVAVERITAAKQAQEAALEAARPLPVDLASRR